MTNNLLFSNGLRWFILLLLQVLILKSVVLGWNGLNYIHILMYPMFIILLPVELHVTVVIMVSFLMGILIDLFYGSLGVHASAAVFTAFVRPVVLTVLEPKVGYSANVAPSKNKYGINWFLRYASMMMFLHLFFYFSVEVFTYVYLGEILIKTILSFIFSMLFVIMYQYLFDPIY